MLWLGQQLANDGTRSIYNCESEEEVACIHQEYQKDTIAFRIEPKKFLFEDHAEDYKKWMKLLINQIKANPMTKDKKILFVSIEDNDFHKAIKSLEPII